MYSTTVTISLPPNYSGLALNAQLYNENGALVGTPITTGFVEIGGGSYIFHYDEFPEGFNGHVSFFQAGFPASVLTGCGVVEPVLDAVSFMISINRSVDNLAAIRGDTFAWEPAKTLYRADNLANVVFSVKNDPLDTDSVAVLRVSMMNGLEWLNGSVALDSTLAQIVALPTGETTFKLFVFVEAEIMAQLESGVFRYDMKTTQGSHTVTQFSGDFTVEADISRTP